jgi:hypothetical protein
VAVPLLGRRKRWIELDRSLECVLCARPIVIELHLDVSERRVGFAEIGGELDRLVDCGAGLRKHVARPALEERGRSRAPLSTEGRRARS